MNRKGIFLTFMVFLLLSTILALSISTSQTELSQQRNVVNQTAFREANTRFSNIRQQILVAKEDYASASQGRFTTFSKFKVGEDYFEIGQQLPLNRDYLDNAYDAINMFSIFAEGTSRKGIDVKVKKPVQNTNWNPVEEEYPPLVYQVTPQCMNFAVYPDFVEVGDISESVNLRNEKSTTDCLSGGISYDDIESYDIEVQLPYVNSTPACSNAFDAGSGACVGEQDDDGLTPYARVKLVWPDCVDEECNNFGFSGGEQVIAANLDPSASAMPFDGIQVDTTSDPDGILYITFYPPDVLVSAQDELLVLKMKQPDTETSSVFFKARVNFKERINQVFLSQGTFDFAVESDDFDICRSTEQGGCGWYDSGEICLEEEIGPGDTSKWVTSLYGGSSNASFEEGAAESTVCGAEGPSGGHYTIDTHFLANGEIVHKTPVIPEAGEYYYSIKYEIGDTSENEETFTITCGTLAHVYTVPDDVEESENYRVATVECDFEQGENQVALASTGIGDVHLESFRIRE